MAEDRQHPVKKERRGKRKNEEIKIETKNE
jgi:hypothetical protein